MEWNLWLSFLEVSCFSVTDRNLTIICGLLSNHMKLLGCVADLCRMKSADFIPGSFIFLVTDQIFELVCGLFRKTYETSRLCGGLVWDGS